MTNFWQEIKRPIIALAPMEDVTDTVFREVIRSVSSADVLNVQFTEFTSTDGLCSQKGRANVSNRLVVSPSERILLAQTGTKLVAQLWGSNPAKFKESAQFVSELGIFDGIDINMGCPVKKVIKSKSCSALINYPDLAQEIIAATKGGTTLPVSVKTRLGFNEVITEKWIGTLLDTAPAAITIHGRTQKMLSNGTALWDEIGKAVELRNKRQLSTLILGNGDVDSYNTAMRHVQDVGVDGVMVGTGVFRNPWMFNVEPPAVTISTRLALIKKHITLYHLVWGDTQSFNVLKRFFKIYINGFDGAAEWRDRMMKCVNCAEALAVVAVMECQLE